MGFLKHRISCVRYEKMHSEACGLVSCLKETNRLRGRQ